MVYIKEGVLQYNCHGWEKFQKLISKGGGEIIRDPRVAKRSYNNAENEIL